MEVDIFYGGKPRFPFKVVSYQLCFYKQSLGFVPTPPVANKNNIGISTSFHCNRSRSARYNQTH
jgi:hypothetical protein